MKLLYSKIPNPYFCLIIITGLLLGLTGCINEDPIINDNGLKNNELTINGSLIIPGMSELATRGNFGNTPNAGLKLTILEFSAPEMNTNAAGWWLNNIYHAETISQTNVNNGGTVNFKFTVKLNANSTKPTKFHLFITDDYLTPNFGSEASLFTDLTVTGNHEAYWGCVKFENGIVEEEEVEVEGEDGEKVKEVKAKLLSDVKEDMNNIPVIRNFAAITVEKSSTVTNFELLDFMVVHTPEEGTIAPIDPDHNPVVPSQFNPTVPDLLNGSHQMKSYSEISKDYNGYTPLNAQFSNTEPDVRKWKSEETVAETTLGPVYLYEHPYESTRRTYLVIYGRYTGGNTPQEGYYKVDIGNTNENTKWFDYYNIIRNINYNVKINAVRAPGTATAGEAIARAPYNNISAATETSSMLNVSNGTNQLFVNTTSYVIVKKEPVEILYRYVKDVNGVKTNGNRDTDLIFNCEVNGPVVESIQGPSDYTDPVTGEEWVKYIIYPKAPDNDVKTQNITIINTNDGLGRTIRLTLRNPWQYAPLYEGGSSYLTVKRGSANIYSFDEGTAAPEDISNQSEKELTVYFNLPNGLPESMFPLKFTLEAQKQGIENNKKGTMVVNYGPSLFNPNVIAISYIKVVSYDEYLYQYENDDSNAVAVNRPNTNHTVRCRFTTISQVTAGDRGTIRVHNPYFTPDISVGFTRTEIK